MIPVFLFGVVWCGIFSDSYIEVLHYSYIFDVRPKSPLYSRGLLSAHLGPFSCWLLHLRPYWWPITNAPRPLGNHFVIIFCSNIFKSDFSHRSQICGLPILSFNSYQINGALNPMDLKAYSTVTLTERSNIKILALPTVRILRYLRR